MSKKRIYKEGEIMKYPMIKKTENPLFEYIVRFNDSLDYYLFRDFDSAIKKAVELSASTKITLLYELCFNNSTREWFGKNTFKVFDGEIKYDKHAQVDLHIQFYVNAGEWLNPNEEWLNLLLKKPLII